MTKTSSSISVVIPTLTKVAVWPETLLRLRLVPEAKEVIVADDGSLA